MVNDTKTKVQAVTHFCGSPACSKSHHVPTMVEDSAMDELVKGMRDLKLKFAMFKGKGQGSGDLVTKTKVGYVRGRLPPRCMWCDNFEHSRRECPHFTVALQTNVVFYKHRRIHSHESSLPLETNFGKGGMKVLVEGLAKELANEKAEQSTYGIGLARDCAGVDIDVPNLFYVVWMSAMELVEGKRLRKDKQHSAGSSIRQATGWNDPVDSLSVHAYIARNQHEELVEEKRKRNDASAGTSKRANKTKKAQQTKSGLNITMKGKSKTPAY